jgi:hypothetical protein
MGGAFPGTRQGRPFGAFALVWALEEEQRQEIAWIELGADRTLTARGRQWRTGDEPHLLDYTLETSPGYVTERLHVQVAGGAELTLRRGAGSELEGVRDCDLGFSPLTNAMPVLRDRMQYGGETREIDVAWVSVPDLTVHRDHQIYEPLGGGRLRFRSPAADFDRVIELTPDGFVRDYPGIARLTARFRRASGEWRGSPPE